ncbi:MAG: hypothetical protein NTW05_02625 [Pseudonocardiales bacterium]|jgi:anti-anti-sigma regulatory factor|nr:hypothetical protein [Pseudonocardiales bacterium]
MWSSDERTVLAVERPAPGIVVVRVAGPLGDTSGARLARLLDVLGTGPTRPRHVVVDLGDVGWFGSCGIAALHAAEAGYRGLGVGLHVSGLSARMELLPVGVADRLARLPGFPTVERAVLALSAPAAEAGRATATAAISRAAHVRLRRVDPAPP